MTIRPNEERIYDNTNGQIVHNNVDVDLPAN